MIIVTGGSGFLGSHLLYYLTQQYEHIVAIKRPTSSLKLVHKVFHWLSEQAEKDLAKIQWIEGDLLDIDFLDELIEEGSEFYHCAAVVSFQKKDQEKLFRYNSAVTENIVNACLQQKARKLCHVSSISALGRVKEGDASNELDFFNFNQKPSIYGTSKFLAEQHVWRGQAEGLSTVIVNPSVILGVGDWSRGSAKLITTVYDGLKFYTKGVNGYIDVRDVATTMISLMQSDIENERFILNTENLSYKDLFTHIAHELKVAPPPFKANRILSSIAWRLVKVWSIITGKDAFITRETARTANKEFFYSSEKIRRALNVEFIPIEQCIKDSCSFFLKDYQRSS